MKRSKEELLSVIRAYVGDRTDDETLSIIEDVSDSMDDVGGIPADYEELRAERTRLESENESLRTRYRERFFSNAEPGGTEEEPLLNREEPGRTEEEPEKVNFSDLFK